MSSAPSRKPSATGTHFTFPAACVSLLNALCGTSRTMAQSERVSTLAPRPTRDASRAQNSAVRQEQRNAHLISNRNSTQMASQFATRLNWNMLNTVNREKFTANTAAADPRRGAPRPA